MVVAASAGLPTHQGPRCGGGINQLNVPKEAHTRGQLSPPAFTRTLRNFKRQEKAPFRPVLTNGFFVARERDMELRTSNQGTSDPAGVPGLSG
jgi:hypothetical protein